MGVLGILGLIFFAATAFLVIVETAVKCLPHSDEKRIQAQREVTSASLRWIVTHRSEAGNALRLWTMWYATAAVIVVSLLAYAVIGNLWAAGVASAFLSAAVGFFLFGGSPRRFGSARSLSIVTRLSAVVRTLTLAVGPIPGWLARCSTKVIPYFSKTEDPLFADTDLHGFVDRARRSRIFEDDETQMLHSVIEFGRIRVRSVLVPRTDLVTIDCGQTLENAVELFVNSGFSRVPVINEDADHIVGVLYAKDVMNAFYQGFRKDTSSPEEVEECADITELMRAAQFIPEAKPISDVLELMKRESNHLAVVIDEYGGTAGIVTLEDIVEEIVGEIVDEYDSHEPEIIQVSEGVYKVKSTASIEDIAGLFGRELSDEHVDTVGGLMSKVLGKVPAAADTVSVGGLKLAADQSLGGQHYYILISEAADDGQSAAQA